MAETQETQIEGIVKSVESLQEELMQGILIAVSIIGILTAGVGTYEAIQSSAEWLIPLYWISYLTVLLFTFWKKPSYGLRAWSLIGLLYVLGATDIIVDGLGGSGRLFLLSLVFVTGILLSRRESIIIIAAIVVTMTGFGIAFSMGVISIPGDARSSQPEAWLVSTLSLMMMGLLIMVSLNYLIPQLVTALQKSRQLTEELQTNQATLTQQVQERLERNAKRSAQLEAITVIGQETMSIQNLDQMLEKAAQAIYDKLGHYFVGIFLTNPPNQYATLKAASSETGLNLLMNRYRVYIGETNFIGSVISRGRSRIKFFEDQDAALFDTPELADTRSQVTLPMIVQNNVIGALDIQSSNTKEFDEEDIDLLQVLADQLALSISNARLYQESQQNLETVRRAYGQLSRQAWQELISRQKIIKRYDPQHILADQPEISTDEAKFGQMSIDENQLTIPIKERGQVIGVIRAQKADEINKWTQEEVNLLNSLTDQLEVALESARLYKDTQQRAEQERMVGEITSRIRETLDIDTILKIAVQEIGEKLGLPNAEVWLTSDQQKDTKLFTPESYE